MEAVRVGVIGLGTFGEVHLKAYAGQPGVEVVGICDLNEERLRKAGDDYGIPARFADYRELLAMDGLDAVSIVTPDFTHTDIVVAAVEQGRAVLVEKPLATTLADCHRIGEALRRNPVPFMVDFHNRWNPGVYRIREGVEAGQLGAVQMAYHRLSDTIFVPTRMLSWAARSSINWFLGSHCLDTLRWILGDEVARVYSVCESRVLRAKGVDTPDYVLSIVEFGGGARAVIETCWILPESSPTIVDFKLEVVGESGTFYYDPMPERLLRLTPDEIACVDTHACVGVHGRTVGFAVESIRHFAECVRTGRRPLVGFEDGLQVSRAVLAMEQSAREGRPVEL
jgi:predicted dehydrogenase